MISFQEENAEEDYAFVFQSMLTCIGNKRKLVHEIKNIIKKEVGKDKLNIVDGFAGSSIVSRALTSVANKLYINDMENYSYLMAKCFLVRPSNDQITQITQHINKMNELAEKGPYFEGIISKLYAPKNTNDIKEGERVFYTRENALIIDTLRKYIDDFVEEENKVYCLAPLLTKASIHTNTAGVFKGFYKDGKIGKFGGKGENALSRIMRSIKVEMPIWSNHSYEAICYKSDINELIDTLPDDLHVVYLDPPYNQHPYGSNYFMLNVIAENKEPENISKVSGIPSNWQRSKYNSNASAVKSMKDLIAKSLTRATFVLLSYNDEGIITNDNWKEIFQPYEVEKKEIIYDTYKGSRNLKNRSNKVVEIMYLISKRHEVKEI